MFVSGILLISKDFLFFVSFSYFIFFKTSRFAYIKSASIFSNFKPFTDVSRFCIFNPTTLLSLIMIFFAVILTDNNGVIFILKPVISEFILYFVLIKSSDILIKLSEFKNAVRTKIKPKYNIVNVERIIIEILNFFIYR